MNNLKITTLAPFIALFIIHQNTNLSDFTVGLSYGIALGLLILAFIPKEKYAKFRAFKRNLLNH